MTAEHVKITGPWSLEQVGAFLEQSRMPVRVSAIGGKGYPVMVSLWYAYRDGCLWCAVQESSRIAQHLARNGRCAFEVSVNEPPYCGVRGQGDAELVKEKGGEILKELIPRFLGDESSKLARWLLDRVESEVAIRVRPLTFSSWDYTRRMGRNVE